MHKQQETKTLDLMRRSGVFLKIDIYQDTSKHLS